MSDYLIKTLILIAIAAVMAFLLWGLIRGVRQSLRALWWVRYQRRMMELGAWLERVESLQPVIVSEGRRLVAVEVADADADLSLENFLKKYGVNEREFCTTYGH